MAQITFDTWHAGRCRYAYCFSMVDRFFQIYQSDNKGGPVLLLLTLFYPFLVNLPQQAVSHDFMLLTAKADVSKVAQACISHPGNGYIDPQMMDEIIAHTGMAEGGETVTVTFTAPERSGNYTYICTFPCHFTLGMKGTLTVQ